MQAYIACLSILLVILVICAIWFESRGARIISNYDISRDSATVFEPSEQQEQTLETSTPASRTFHSSTPKQVTKHWMILVDQTNATFDWIKVAQQLPQYWTILILSNETTNSLEQILDDPLIHCLSQHDLDVSRSLKHLPYASYMSRAAGYMYALRNGAEWIYDVDDHAKPLERFDGLLGACFDEDAGGGLRYQPGSAGNKLFNWKAFYGSEKCEDCLGSIWKPDLRSCRKQGRSTVMLSPVAQASSSLQPNKFAPSVTLAPGTFTTSVPSNTLIHRSAAYLLPFFSLTKKFDSWRSIFAQKILSLSGQTLAVFPVHSTAMKLTNKADPQDDQKKVKIIMDLLSNWQCPSDDILSCMKVLIMDMYYGGFIGDRDPEVVEDWMQDLHDIGYSFPNISSESQIPYQYMNESDRIRNCRPVRLSFRGYQMRDEKIERAKRKLSNMKDLHKWCFVPPANHNETSMPDTIHYPTAMHLAQSHANNKIVHSLRDKVLIITNNWPWKFGIGLLQRLYGEYFAHIVFCGPFQEYNSTLDADFPPIQPDSFSYIHLSNKEDNGGMAGYYCLAKVAELHLQNVKGYYMISDDMIFNIWHPNVELDKANGYRRNNKEIGFWWPTSIGIQAAQTIVDLIRGKYKETPWVQRLVLDYNRGLADNGYYNATRREPDILRQIMNIDGWAVSDWIYIPAGNITFARDLLELFFEAELFHEIAMSKMFYALPVKWHGKNLCYLWLDKERDNWTSAYSPDILGLHPMKMSTLVNPPKKKELCEHVVDTFYNKLFA